MAASRFLISFCDNSQDPTIVQFDNLSKEQLREIKISFELGMTICGKESTLGCFTFIGDTIDPENIVIYGDIELFSSCDDCYFSNKIDEFKSNVNILDKYENTKSTIRDIITRKVKGDKK